MTLNTLAPQDVYNVPLYAEGIYLVGVGMSRPNNTVDMKGKVSFGYDPQAINVLPPTKMEVFDTSGQPFDSGAWLIMRPFGVSKIGNPGMTLRFRSWDLQNVNFRFDLYGFVL